MTLRDYKESYFLWNLPFSDVYEYLSDLEVEQTKNFAVSSRGELNSSFESPRRALAQAKRAEKEPDIYLAK